MYNGFVSSYKTTQFQFGGGEGHEEGGFTPFNIINNTPPVLDSAVIWQETRKLWYVGLEMLCNGGLIRECWQCLTNSKTFSATPSL
jgi:hypothetical protein